jgi:low affinity Fe/Cu permease
MNEIFRKIASQISVLMGSAWVFVLAVTIIVVWAVTGPIFQFSNTWQLIINTGTTIVTFLMVFLIQNTQNREAKATQIKLDELIRALKGARDSLVDIENLSDEELAKLEVQFKKLHDKFDKKNGQK